MPVASMFGPGFRGRRRSRPVDCRGMLGSAMTPRNPDGLRCWQLREGAEGTARVLQLGGDYAVAAMTGGPTIVYDRDCFAREFPVVVERSSLERIEARRAS